MALPKAKVTYSDSSEPQRPKIKARLTAACDDFPLAAQFQCKEVKETETHYVLIAEKVTYKVFKHIATESADLRTFQTRWQLACEEYYDSLTSASGLYLGLRTFRWLDGKIVWLQDAPLTEANPNDVPQLADDVCLVIRHIPEELSIHNIYQKQGYLSEGNLRALAKNLFNFQQQQIQKEKNHKRYDFDLVAADIIQTLEDNLRKLKLYAHSSRNRLLSVLIDEVQGLLNRKIETILQLNFDRAEQHLLIDGLGSPRLKNTFLARLPGNTSPVVFTARKARSNFGRRMDVMSDLVSLLLDFEELGDSVAAQALEHYYYELFPEGFCRELRDFIFIFESIQRAGCLEHSAMEHIARAFRKLIQLEPGCMILIGGEENEEKQQLVKSISDLLDAHSINEAEYKRALIQGQLAEELVFRTGDRSNLIISATLERRFERMQLYRIAEQQRIPYFFIRCEYGRDEISAMNVLAVHQHKLEHQIQTTTEYNLCWDQQIMGKKFGVILVEPTVSLPLLALSLVHNLKQLTTKKNAGSHRLKGTHDNEDEITGGLKDILDVLAECELRTFALDNPLKRQAN